MTYSFLVHSLTKNLLEHILLLYYDFVNYTIHLVYNKSIQFWTNVYRSVNKFVYIVYKESYQLVYVPKGKMAKDIRRVNNLNLDSQNNLLPYNYSYIYESALGF